MTNKKSAVRIGIVVFVTIGFGAIGYAAASKGPTSGPAASANAAGVTSATKPGVPFTPASAGSDTTIPYPKGETGLPDDVASVKATVVKLALQDQMMLAVPVDNKTDKAVRKGAYDDASAKVNSESIVGVWSRGNADKRMKDIKGMIASHSAAPGDGGFTDAQLRDVEFKSVVANGDGATGLFTARFALKQLPSDLASFPIGKDGFTIAPIEYVSFRLVREGKDWKLDALYRSLDPPMTPEEQAALQDPNASGPGTGTDDPGTSLPSK